MAEGFAAAITEASTKREMNVEFFAVASNIFDLQVVVSLGKSFGASVLPEHIDPGCTDAGQECFLFVHERSADSAG